MTARSSSADEGELLWALRGAGGARFGVVTQLTLQTVPAPVATALHLELARRARRRSRPGSASTPRTRWPPACSIIGGTAHVFGAYIGPPSEAAGAARPVRRHAASSRSSPTATSSGAWPRPAPATARTCRSIARASSRSRSRSRSIRRSSTTSHRSAAPTTVSLPTRPRSPIAAPASCSRSRARPRSTAPCRTGATGVYVNFPEPDRDFWDVAYLGTNRDRLLELRAAYDPHRVFACDRSAKT